jgi:L-ascorbate metabolism protein UlaG (beta-lactamase superfamily)
LAFDTLIALSARDSGATLITCNREDFAEIGRRFGSFELALLPIGAYGGHWPDIHLTPEEATLACRDLGGRLLLPIHWGTFNLAFHAWHEPPERLIEAVRHAGIPVALPMPGQPFTTANPPPNRPWWDS